jgi:hypothetical protein
MRTSSVSCWLGAIVATVAVVSAQGQQSNAPRKLPSGGEPQWIRGSILSDVDSNLVVIGTADAGTEKQALANSLNSACFRAATELVKRRLAEDRLPLTISFETFSIYIRRIGRVTDTHVQQNARAGYRGYTRLVVNKGLVDPVTVRNLATSSVKSGENSAVGYLVVPAETKDFAMASYRVPVRSAKWSDGNFLFVFTLTPVRPGSGMFQGSRAGGVRIRLEQLEVIDDGSPAGTTWAFEVAVNGRPALRLPASNFDDSVGRYTMRKGDPNLEYTTSGSEPNIELHVVGTRP